MGLVLDRGGPGPNTVRRYLFTPQDVVPLHRCRALLQPHISSQNGTLLTLHQTQFEDTLVVCATKVVRDLLMVYI